MSTTYEASSDLRSLMNCAEESVMSDFDTSTIILKIKAN